MLVGPNITGFYRVFVKFLSYGAPLTMGSTGFY